MEKVFNATDEQVQKAIEEVQVIADKLATDESAECLDILKTSVMSADYHGFTNDLELCVLMLFGICNRLLESHGLNNRTFQILYHNKETVAKLQTAKEISVCRGIYEAIKAAQLLPEK